MKLEECIKIGKDCGLTTLGEAYDNINHSAMSLFIWGEIPREMIELQNEIATKHNLKVIDTNIDKIFI